MIVSGLADEAVPALRDPEEIRPGRSQFSARADRRRKASNRPPAATLPTPMPTRATTSPPVTGSELSERLILESPPESWATGVVSTSVAGPPPGGEFTYWAEATPVSPRVALQTKMVAAASRNRADDGFCMNAAYTSAEWPLEIFS